jgi:hypothetical protein
MTQRDRQISAEIGLPFLKIGTNDVGAFFRRRTRRFDGPFLLISVHSGLGITTGLEIADGGHPLLWGPNGKPHQLWSLEPTGYGSEVHIISVHSGLLLDAQGLVIEQPLRLRGRSESDNAPWQRWQMLPAPGGRAHRIINVGTGYALDSPWDTRAEEGRAVPGTRPILWHPHTGENQQWVLAMPFAPQDDS